MTPPREPPDRNPYRLGVRAVEIYGSGCRDLWTRRHHNCGVEASDAVINLVESYFYCSWQKTPVEFWRNQEDVCEGDPEYHACHVGTSATAGRN